MYKVPALFSIDAYKLGHMVQYPKGTEYIYSNLTPRSMKHFTVPEGFKNDKIVAFGMYAAVNSIVDAFNEFFEYDDFTDITKFCEAVAPFAGPNGVDKDKFADLLDLGYLPLRFKALPEGSIVSPQIPVLTVENTNPDFYWLTNFDETWLSAEAWKPMTVATIAYNYRKILEHYATLTGSPLDFVDWQGHDFSSRGMSGIEDAANAGMGHLVFFKGTDNISAAWKISQVYDTGGEFIGGSVPATEHSVMCVGGQEDEIQTFRRLITEVYPAGIVSIVSDTWDFWKVITEYTVQLKDEILNRQPDELGMSKVVFRPDSGDPVEIICGTAAPLGATEYLWDQPDGHYVKNGCYYDVINGEIHQHDRKDVTPESKGAVECLWEIFGGNTTEAGYWLLDPRVGLIYGDSITLERASTILDRLAKKNFASGNIVFGIGSYTYQYITRDTLGIAMKATWGQVNGVGQAIFKNPVTDTGKKSATGLLQVKKENGKFVLNQDVTREEEQDSELITIFENGRWRIPTPKLSEIRANVTQTT